VLPTFGYRSFKIQANNEQVLAKVYIPKATPFTFFECYSLITNVNFKNMFTIRFTPATPIPTGGKLIMWVPTVNEWGAPLFDNDLRTGKSNGDKINCYTRSGFLANVILSCTIIHGV
jgi:hypothetical protein